MTQYIYGLHNGDCEIRYIGKTNNPAKRMRDHRNNARANRYDFPVYRWMRKHGPEKIEMVIEAELSDDEDIDNYEIAYIDMYRNFDNLLNVTSGGEGTLGRAFSEETKAKMSTARLGNQWALGNKHSPETIEKIKVARATQVITEETKAKMSAAHMGRVFSEESRAKISASQKGNQKALGHKHSEETKAKIARGNHTRWHVNRNIINPECKFCQEVFV